MTHAKARLDVYVQPPRRDPGRALASWKQATTLNLDRAVAGHLWLEDEHGVRLREAHKAAEQPLTVALLPRERYYLTLGSAEYSFTAAPGTTVRFESLVPTAGGLRARGSIDDAFQRGSSPSLRPGGAASYQFPRWQEPAVRALASEAPRARPLGTIGAGLVISALAVGVAASRC